MSDILYPGKPGEKWAGFILVHADGGDCHGTPLVANPHWPGSRRCPKCGISPDMQSTEFWAPEDVKR